MSETQLNEVGNVEMRLKMQNWMVLFPAAGHTCSKLTIEPQGKGVKYIKS